MEMSNQLVQGSSVNQQNINMNIKQDFNLFVKIRRPFEYTEDEIIQEDDDQYEIVRRLDEY